MSFFESKQGVSLIKVIQEYNLEDYNLPKAKIVLPVAKVLKKVKAKIVKEKLAKSLPPQKTVPLKQIPLEPN